MRMKIFSYRKRKANEYLWNSCYLGKKIIKVVDRLIEEELLNFMPKTRTLICVLIFLSTFCTLF